MTQRRQDYVVVATVKNGGVLAYAATTRHVVGELQRRHDTWPVVTAALGRVATMGALLTAGLKHEEHRVTLQVQGGGPIGKIVVVATGRGTVKGYADEAHVDFPLQTADRLLVFLQQGTTGPRPAVAGQTGIDGPAGGAGSR